mmetsp:Transcript_14962/g.21400  ORF Transcript_14962/g.21400 Transcript_14962/m.21400 type:complete len:259 (-) Transcript_14962:518-1294(-)
MRRTPSARVTVTQMGNPSGMAATARLTATVTVFKKGLPRHHPSNAMSAIMIPLSPANIFPNSSIFVWSGLLRVSTSFNSCATFPNSVRDPMAMTRARPLPPDTSVPMNATFCCSMRGRFGRPFKPVPAEVTIGSADPVFSTGVFSPVSDDSSTDSSTVSTNLQSAGTRSPVPSITKSPTTKSLAGKRFITLPSLITVQVCGTRSASFSSAASDRYSCTAATMPTIANANPILNASAISPIIKEIKAETNSMRISGSLS